MWETFKIQFHHHFVSVLSSKNCSSPLDWTTLVILLYLCSSTVLKSSWRQETASFSFVFLVGMCVSGFKYLAQICYLTLTSVHGRLTAPSTFFFGITEFVIHQHSCDRSCDTANSVLGAYCTAGSILSIVRVLTHVTGARGSPTQAGRLRLHSLSHYSITHITHLLKCLAHSRSSIILV